MQVAGHDNVFAIGDVSDADAKMAGRAGRQAHLVAENIRKLIERRRRPQPRTSRSARDHRADRPEPGSGQLPNQDGLAPRELVSAAKGHDLMVDRYAEILVLAARSPDA